MLQFAKGVPLGDKGLDWLKIHLVTLHGALKKASLQERLQYADKMMDEILDSADNPLTVSENEVNRPSVSDASRTKMTVSSPTLGKRRRDMSNSYRPISLFQLVSGIHAPKYGIIM